MRAARRLRAAVEAGGDPTGGAVPLPASVPSHAKPRDPPDASANLPHDLGLARKALELALALGVPLGSTPFAQVAERAARAQPPALDVVEATVAKMVEASRAHAAAAQKAAAGVDGAAGVGGGGGVEAGAVWEPPEPRVWALLLSRCVEHNEPRRGVALLEAMRAVGISRAKITFHQESLSYRDAPQVRCPPRGFALADPPLPRLWHSPWVAPSHAMSHAPRPLSRTLRPLSSSHRSRQRASFMTGGRE